MLIVIAGPTAVGKSEISIEIALELNAEIISADSMQIWKGMDIGTAKIDKAEREKIPHYMIDVADFNCSYSVSDWLTDAEQCYKSIISKGKNVIITGGTGMYIRAFLYGYTLNKAPASNEIRQKYNTFLEEKGKECLYSLLEAKLGRKPDLHINDTKRVIRALEILEINGAIDESKQIKPRFKHLMFVLNLDREELYKKINQRTEQMILAGLIDETASLKAKGAVSEMQSMQAIGYRETLMYLDGKLNIGELRELISKNTRNYAKRQLTYFRGFSDAVWINKTQETKSIKEAILSQINQNQ